MPSPAPFRHPTERAALAPLVLATSAAVMMLNLAPWVEAQLRQALGYSAADAGRVLFVELAAMGLVSLPAGHALRRIGPAALARWGYALFLLGNLLAPWQLASPIGYAAARAVSGLGAGALMVWGMSLAARTPTPDRVYAVITCWQGLSGAALLLGLGTADGAATTTRALTLLYGAGAMLAVLGLAGTVTPAGLASPAAGSTTGPAGARSSAPATDRAGALAAPGRRPGQIGRVTGMALSFNLAVGGLWAFAAEYAGSATTPAQVTAALAGATLAGLAGSVLAWRAGGRWPRQRLLRGGLAGLALGAGLLHLSDGLPGFAVGCAVLSLAWSFSVPFVFAAVAAQDPTGRLMAWASLAFAAGLALGPLLAGALLEAWGRATLFPCATLALAVCAGLGYRPPPGSGA